MDLIAAEDTRVTRKLLARYEIETPLTPFHEHNLSMKLPNLLDRLATEDIALVSDAGTPTINDPGRELVTGAAERRYKRRHPARRVSRDDRPGRVRTLDARVSCSWDSCPDAERSESSCCPTSAVSDGHSWRSRLRTASPLRFQTCSKPSETGRSPSAVR